MRLCGHGEGEHGTHPTTSSITAPSFPAPSWPRWPLYRSRPLVLTRTLISCLAWLCAVRRRIIVEIKDIVARDLRPRPGTASNRKAPLHHASSQAQPLRVLH